MKRILLIAVGLLLASPASAADLAMVDRALAKEPAYQTKTPTYCLLVFGTEAKTRVWLVVDGGTLYVDKNANGDLTEAGEAVPLSRPEQTGLPQYTQRREAGNITITDGKFKHTDLRLTQSQVNPNFAAASESDHQLKSLAAKDPQAVVYSLSVYAECRRLPRGKIDFTGRVLHYAGSDEQGYLQFGPEREQAPVIHFGGPWQIAPLCRHSLKSGEKPGDLMAMVGTPGHGPGTFASLSYSGLIDEGPSPTATIEFPLASGKGTLKEAFVLKHRC
jgi:hypothetical protein